MFDSDTRTIPGTIPDAGCTPRKPARRRSRARSVAAWIATIVAIMGWTVFLRPQTLGGPAAFVGVHGTSMLPTLKYGDLVIVHRQPSYRVGDIVAFRVPQGQPGAGGAVIHRIIGGDATSGFLMQGDNNSYTDIWKPTTDDIVGKVWLRLPALAALTTRLRSPVSLAIAIGVMSFVILVLPDRDRQDRKNRHGKSRAETARSGPSSPPPHSGLDPAAAPGNPVPAPEFQYVPDR